MAIKKKKQKRPMILSEAERDLIHEEILSLRSKSYQLADENTALKKQLFNKGKHLLVAMAIYSFIVTLLAAKNQPVFLADLHDFGATLKFLAVSPFNLAMTASEFLGEFIEMIPVNLIASILQAVTSVILVGGIYFVVLVLLIFILVFLNLCYVPHLADSITVGFMLTTLAGCVFLSEGIRELVPINLVLLYILVNAVYAVIRRLVQKLKSGSQAMEADVKDVKKPGPVETSEKESNT